MGTTDLNTENQIRGSDTQSFIKNLKSFIESCRGFLPVERIIIQAQEIYSPCPSLALRQIPLALKLITETEVKAVVALAQSMEVPLYTVSSGINWGYGTANPVRNNCVILDLSMMNKILEFNDELDWVRLQPGVTQEQLHQYLVENNLSYIIPVTGAGPQGSLIGNLLERGYGITPYQDHFESLLSLKAVLADGRTYQSAFREIAGPQVGHSFRWGLGPYLDGIFAQSNFGIVTEVTMALARRPEKCEAFYFTLQSDADFEKAIVAIREIRQTLGSSVGGINLLNSRRMVAMHVPYPKNFVKAGEIMSEGLLKKICHENNIAAWTGIGGLYGTRKMVKAAKSFIRTTLKPFAKEIIFVDSQKHGLLKKVLSLTRNLPFAKKLNDLSERVGNLLDVVEGRPTRAALPLAYWKTDVDVRGKKDFNPSRDDCGFYWYSPVISKNAREVHEHFKFVEGICSRYGIEPLITLTSLNERCFDNPMPILFRKDDPEDTRRAQACYKELMTEGMRRGYCPYRFGVDQMSTLTSNKNSVYWDVASLVKKALDPKLILSPGRYNKL